MAQFEISSEHSSTISASWMRCREQHHLARDTKRPNLRLQSSEVVPRLESVLDRLSGSQTIVQRLAKPIVTAGNCLAITDSNGILVQLDSNNASRGTQHWNGIALGSCWDERLAGTNGVSMALLEQRAVTVRGSDHFFSRYSPFSCTAVPLLDADNQLIGVLNLSAIDRGHPTDYLSASHLLQRAADRVQCYLFEEKFKEARIISVSQPVDSQLLHHSELVALDENGLILGSTARAFTLAGMSKSDDLRGKSVEELFGADVASLREPARIVRVQTDDGLKLSLQRHMQGRTPQRHANGLHKAYALTEPVGLATNQRRLTPSLKQLAIGSKQMSTLCDRAKEYFKRSLPFVIEGASGTGKSALVNGLHDKPAASSHRVLTVDCPTLSEDDDDRRYFRSQISQAMSFDSRKTDGDRITTIVLDNIDELPLYAQALLRKSLGDVERLEATTECPVESGVRIIATCSNPLDLMVEKKQFREDLYFLLASSVIRLPGITQREHPEKLMQSVATSLVGAQVEITEEALQALLSYDWPGNIRQLRSILHQALIQGDGRRISLLDLSATPVHRGEGRRSSAPIDKPPAVALKDSYDERAMLTDALTGARWNASLAARRLGIGRATIYRKMTRFGITRPD